MQHFAKHSLRSVLLCVLSFLLFQESFSQVNLTTTTYSQDFNTLPTTGSTNTWTNNSTISGWYAERASGTTAGTTVTAIIAGSGTSATGALYSLGTGTGTDRALGSTCSGTFGNVATGLRVLNQTGVSISSFTISYTGEQWRRENNASVQKLQFAYKIGSSLTTLDATSITAGGFTVITALDFSSPIVGATTGAALDGNAAANRTVISNVIISLPSPLINGQEIMLKWLDINDAGNDHIMGVDDFTIVATPSSPTLTATPTTLPPFNYTFGNGPSTASSYNLSGSVLTPTADTVKIFAPTNFEISKSAGSGYKDTLNIRYSGGAFTPISIYVRLKAGLAVSNAYGDTIRHSGGGVNISTLPKVRVSGSVTSVPPPSITTTGSLLPFYTITGTPSVPQSYVVSGSDLLADIKIKAPTGFQIKTGAGSYLDSLLIPQTSGSVANTTIDMRLKGIVAGTFTGNITNTSTTASANVAVNGTVIATIAAVRLPIPEQNTYTGSSVTIAGRVSVRFGNNKFYLQDATGGIAVYSATGTGIVPTYSIADGDSVLLTGVIKRFNGEIEILDPTYVNRIAGSGASTTPALFVFDSNSPPSGVNLATFLDVNEGRRVKIISANFVTTGNFSNSTNYPISTCNGQGDSEIRIDASGTQTLTGTAIPTATQDITGVIGHYITSTGAVNILQIFPSSPADLFNSTLTCVPVVATSAASCGALSAANYSADSTLDVTAWNVEWLGNTTATPSPLGPTNDAQQMTNVLAVLNATKADVFCIEEVCDHNQFIARVGTDLPGYGVSCQTAYYSHFFDTPETPGNATTYSQKVCFVYKTAIVSPVTSQIKSLLSDVYTYNPPAGPNNWASGRLPYLFVANVTLGGVTKKIHFVGLHAKSGSALADYNRRNQDVKDLKAKLDSNAVYANANLIILGDYNDDLDTSIAASKPSSYKNFVTDKVRYNQISKSLSDCKVSSTAKYPDIIDHFMTSNEIGVIPTGTQTVTPSVSDIYYLEKTINVSRPINYVTSYTTSTSDHYPVNARFKFGIPATIKSVASGNWSLPATWDCNCVPQSINNVTVDTPHTVTVDVASLAKNVDVKGVLNYVSALMLSLGL